jgi:hypothetical protein
MEKLHYCKFFQTIEKKFNLLSENHKITKYGWVLLLLPNIMNIEIDLPDGMIV